MRVTLSDRRSRACVASHDMHEFLFQYHKVYPTTWAYLSSLLMIGLYFKFGRFWSVRNLDLVLLVMLAPGLLLVHAGHELQLAAAARNAEEAAAEKPAAEESPPPTANLPGDNNSTPPLETDDDDPAATSREPIEPVVAVSLETLQQEPAETEAPAAEAVEETKTTHSGRDVKRAGYVWLFGVAAVILARLLADPNMVRRPLLEPNLSQGGMVFIGVSMFLFLMANIVTSVPTDEDLRGSRAVEQYYTSDTVAQGEPDSPTTGQAIDLRRYGPGYPLLHALPALPTITFVVHDTKSPNANDANYAHTLVAKTMAILAHLAIHD